MVERDLTRTERRRLDTRRRLCEAVIDLLVDGEDQPLTSRAVASRADVAIGTFYNHFEDVEAAIREALRPLFDRWNQLQPNLATTTDDIPAALGVALARFIRVLQTDPRLWLALRRAGWDLSGFGDGTVVQQLIDSGIGVPAGEGAAERAAQLTRRLLLSMVDEVLNNADRPELPTQLGRVAGAALITDTAALQRLVASLDEEYRHLREAG